MKTPQEVLTEVLNKWPKADDDIQDIEDRLGEYLAPDFELSNFNMLIDLNSIKLSRPLVHGKTAKILLESHEPIMVLMTRKDDESWGISLIAHLCPACFGLGIDGAGFCYSCGGTGWGILGDIEFCKCIDNGE